MIAGGIDDTDFDLKVNMALVLRGNVKDLERILKVIRQELGDSMLLFKDVSADKLWIEKHRDDKRKDKERYEI